MWTETDKIFIRQERPGPPPPPPEEKVNFEDVLQIVGGYGKYQKTILWLLVFPISFVTAFLSMNQIFLLSTPNHWCYEPTVFSAGQLTLDEKRTLVNPPNTDPHSTSSSDSCQLYDLNYTSVLEDLKNSGKSVSAYVTEHSSNWSKIPCKYGWEFDKSFYRKTATTDWQLVCDDDYLPSLVFTLAAAGGAVGTPIFGTTSDRFGRKPVTLAIVIIGIVSSALTVLFPWFYGFAIAQGVCGSVYPELYQIPLLLLLEMVSPEGRARANACCSVGWTAGLAALPLVAWLTADWIFFGWTCAALTFPFLACYWFLPESPRWLLAQGRLNEAKAVLQNIAKKNGKDISSINMTSILEECFHLEKESSNANNVSPLEFLKKPTLLKRLLLMAMSWSAVTMAYNAFHYNVGALYGNEFVSFCLLAIVEFPSYLVSWYMMESKLGRRWSNVIFLFLTTVACFLPTTDPHGSKIFTTLASLVGKFGVAASLMVLFQQSAEIFPTPLRATGMAIAETVANVMAICTPYVIYLNMYGSHIPFIVMGFVCLAASVCALFVPETLNKNLPQTVEDGVSFGKEDKFFTLAKKN